MKKDVKIELSTDVKIIFDRNMTVLVVKDYPLENAVILTPFAIRAKLVPKLPKTFDKINFTLLMLLTYTKTTEGKHFLRFDNKDNSKRISIWMYEYGIERLRDMDILWNTMVME